MMKRTITMQDYRMVRLVVLVAAIGLLAACAAVQPEPAAEPFQEPTIEGSPARGAQLIQNYGCGACHTIPGIPGANTVVGPPLSDFSERRYIAGSLPNTAENLVRWIQNPHAIEPNTAMPDLGVPQDEASDIAAYLYALE